MTDQPHEANANRYDKSVKCPKCKKMTALYLRTEALHGNIYAATSDTEVTHYYTCDSCGHNWSTYA